MRMLRSLAVAVAAASVLVFTAAAPAAAHDELIGSSPESGQRLVASPDAVTLTYSGDVLTIGAAVIIADASGRDWAAGPPEILFGAVTVPLEADMPDAGYEIRWRVVSEDGHPISGIIPFTVGDAEPLVRTPAPTQSTSPSTDADQPALRPLLVGAGGAAVAAAAFVLILLFRRRTDAGAGETQP